MAEPESVARRGASAGHRPRRLTAGLELPAALRLVGGSGPSAERQARALVRNAPHHGIDFSDGWVTVDEQTRPVRVRQVCLAVPGAGRTVMLFLSPPSGSALDGPSEPQADELSACIVAACEGARRRYGAEAHLAQALVDASDGWCGRALRAAGFRRLATLVDMTIGREGLRSLRASGGPAFPPDVTVRPLGRLGTRASPTPERGVLLAALESSYERTLDCPGLTALRTTEDVLDSHQAAGVFDPGCWHVIDDGAGPGGCCLLSRSGVGDGAELVYLGLSPRLRGRGLASALLRHGMGCLGDRLESVRCAVDGSNQPALRLYRSLGFVPGVSRAAWVRSLGLVGGEPAGAA